MYPGDVVLDPFCGRGTVLLEASLRNRSAWGTDVLETALLLSRAKLSTPPREVVLAEIEALDLSKAAPPRPADFADLYHEETWRELWNLREAGKSSIVTALALGRLHGHSSGFFSAFTFNVVSVRPPSLKRLRKKHDSELPYRDIKQLLLRAANRFVPEEGHMGTGRVLRADARDLPFPDESVDLVITSPPFLDVIDYPDVNWLREWFVNSGPPQDPFFCRDQVEYSEFIRQVLVELRRVVIPGGRIVFEVGPVKRQTQMATLVCDAAEGVLELEDVAVNEFKATGSTKTVPKISRAMHGGKETTTTANHCVVFR
jgi:ubiquinone/menaquinone biosynthesis C-methylase UbiE